MVCLQRSAWRLVERTAAHPRFADLYMLPSYEDGWHREFRCSIPYVDPVAPSGQGGSGFVGVRRPPFTSPCSSEQGPLAVCDTLS